MHEWEALLINTQKYPHESLRSFRLINAMSEIASIKVSWLIITQSSALHLNGYYSILSLETILSA